MKMDGLTWTSLKKHPSLIPLFGCLIFGGLAGTIFTLRCAMRNPEVTWSHKKNPEPWNEYKDKQYKLYSPSMDYSKVKSQAPEY